MKRLSLTLLMTLALGLGACQYLKTGEDVAAKLAATPAGAALLKWAQGFKPSVDGIVAKIDAALLADAADVKMLCGGANTMDALFNATVLFVQIPSGAVEGERLGFKVVQDVCAAAKKGVIPEGHALAAFWTDTKAALANAGLKF